MANTVFDESSPHFFNCAKASGGIFSLSKRPMHAGCF